MKKLLIILVVLFSLSCEKEQEPVSIDGLWVGYAYVSDWKFLVEFDITTAARGVFGYMYFYADTMPIIEPSYFTEDSVIMYVDYVIEGVEFRFDGGRKRDGNICGTYFINGADGPRTEPFEIYRKY